MYTLLIIIAVNAAGYLLRFYELDRFIILLGFRFHIGLLLTSIILFKKDFWRTARQSLLKPEGAWYLPVYLLLLPAAVALAVLFLLNGAALADPDYLYELGLSSVIDLPVYLFWNMPQLLMLSLFLKHISEKIKLSFPLIFFVTILLFAYEFVPLGKTAEIDLHSIYIFLAFTFIYSLLLSLFKNVYTVSASIFAILWSYILLFGSTSVLLIKMLLARTYDKWDGFFEVAKPYNTWSMLAFAGIVLLLVMIPAGISRPKVDS